jgi:hypothetical protein
MKHVVMLLSLFFILIFPFSAEAAPVGHFIQYTPCLAQDGTYRTAVQAIITDGSTLELQYRINSGTWISVGIVSNGWAKGHAYLPEGTLIEYHYVGDAKIWGIDFQGTNYPECPRSLPKPAEPIFQMWLLTKSDSACILISEYHPSVESQKRLCFPGQDWVADKAPCNGWVYDNGFWDCDIYGYSRLPFASLFKIYERHLAVLKELSQ